MDLRFFKRSRKVQSEVSPISDAEKLHQGLSAIDIRRFMVCYRSVVQRAFSVREGANLWEDAYDHYEGLITVKNETRKVAIEESPDESLGQAIAFGTTIALAALTEYVASAKQRELFPDVPEQP